MAQERADAAGAWEPPARRRRWLWAGAASGVVVVVALFAGGDLPDEDASGLVVRSGEDPTPPATADRPPAAPLARGEWEMVTDGPAAGRRSPRTAWSGREALVWAEQPAAYDPAARSWRQLAGAPVGPRSDPAVVWTGEPGAPGHGLLIVWGGGTVEADWRRDGAGYDPKTDTWSRLPAAPLAPRRGAPA